MNEKQDSKEDALVRIERILKEVWLEKHPEEKAKIENRPIMATVVYIPGRRRPRREAESDLFDWLDI